MPIKTSILVATMILSALLASQALSLNQSITIPGSGYIVAMQSRAAESQWRGVLLGGDTTANYTLIASTLSPYGVNFVVPYVIWSYKSAYHSYVVNYNGGLDFTALINAFHAQGIQVYAYYGTMLDSYYGDSIDRGSWYIPYGQPVSALAEYGGAPTWHGGWLDIANPASVTLVHNIINELVGNYSIDGICFDYTRWDDYIMPCGNYDFAQFKADMGLDTNATYTQWLQDICPISWGSGNTGIYTTQFLEWRNNLITTFVHNMTQWALAINPNLKFDTTCHTVGGGSSNPDYYTTGQGQDVAAWIKDGSVQSINPMIYQSSVSAYHNWVIIEENLRTAGAHGNVPIVPTITDDLGNTHTTTPAQFASWVNASISAGADGWLIMNYGGPGAGASNTYPDITPFLNQLNLTANFALTSITATALSSGSEQISWITSSVANSTVEYNSSQLYVWSQLNATDEIASGFPYWQDIHVTGNVITNTTTTTNHVITLNGLTVGTTYYFRIQSGDPSGIATTPVMTFSTKQTG
jgi:uncharacterized lipoprotein YddW (UPF0748 family)